jgi:hypothetical protein
VKGITRPPYSGLTFAPAARASDIRTPLVGEKHVCAAIEALRLTLQPPCAHGQRRQIGIVGDDHKDIDILGIWLGRHDRAQQANSTDPGDLSCSRHESAQRVEQLLTVSLGSRGHRRFNPVAERR